MKDKQIQKALARGMLSGVLVLLLINPVIRVAFTAFGFAVRRDWLYTAICTLVLAVLLLSFFW